MGYRGEDVSRSHAERQPPWQSSSGNGSSGAGPWDDGSRGYTQGYEENGYEGADTGAFVDHQDYAQPGYGSYSGYGSDAGRDTAGRDSAGGYGGAYQEPDGASGYDRARYGQARADYGQTGYGQAGYDQSGYDQSGYDQSGYDQSGYDQSGYDQSAAGYPAADGYDRRDARGYQDPGAGGYQQQAGEGYQRPAADGYQNPGGGGYQRPAADYQDPAGGGYQQGGYPGQDAGNDWYGTQPAAASGASFADTGTYQLNGRVIDEYGTGPGQVLRDRDPVRGYPPASTQPQGRPPLPALAPAPTTTGPQATPPAGPRGRHSGQQDRFDNDYTAYSGQGYGQSESAGVPPRGGSGPYPAAPDLRGTGSYPAAPDLRGTGSYPAVSDRRGTGAYPAAPDLRGSGSYPAVSDQRGSGGYPAVPDVRGSGGYPAVPDLRGSAAYPAVPDLDGFDDYAGQQAPRGYVEPGAYGAGDYDDYDASTGGYGAGQGSGGQDHGGYDDYAPAVDQYADDPYAGPSGPYGDDTARAADTEAPGRGGRSRAGGRSRPAGRGRRSSLFAALAIFAVAVVGVAAYVFVIKGHTPANNPNAAGAIPSVGASSSAQAACAQTLGPYCHIDLASGDPTPLTVSEVFPLEFQNTTDKISYSLAVTKLDKTCAKAVIGPDLTAALKKGQCTQVLRASYVSTSGKIMGTIGVVNLSSTNQAHYAGKVVGVNDFIAPLDAPKGVASKMNNGTGLVEASFKGHYLILTWSIFVNGAKPTTTAQIKELELFGKDLVAGTVNIPLSQRMVTGAPAVAGAA